MLRGNFPAKVDAQGRLKIPTAHRRILEQTYGPEVFITSLTGEHALIYPLSEWEEFEAKMLEPPREQPSKFKFLTVSGFFGQLASLDKQGRVSLQPLLREAASLEGEVAVIGYLNHLRVWNQEKILQQLRDNPYTTEDAAALAGLGM